MALFGVVGTDCDLQVDCSSQKLFELSQNHGIIFPVIADDNSEEGSKCVDEKVLIFAAE